MKKALVLVLSVVIAGLSSCSIVKSSSISEDVTLTGTIQEMGMTTFQYGSHKIKSADKTFALKSSKVQLADFTDKAVTLKGTKVVGYPIEGGPELIEVSSITLK
jgi:hypothetical protein